MAWKLPDNLPNLGGAPCLAIDLETRDPNLKRMGPGGVRGDGYVIGVAVAVDGWKGYLPIKHEGGGNLDQRIVCRWLNAQLAHQMPKIGANLLYDMEWLGTIGVEAAGPWYDVQGAAALLDENRRSYSLDALGIDYLQRGKDETLLLEGAVGLRLKKKDNVKEHLWRLAPAYVGPYAEQDAVLALDLWTYLEPKLREQGLWPVWELEARLLEGLLRMRQLGVRVDLEMAAELRTTLTVREIEATAELSRLAGVNVDVWSSDSIAKAFIKAGLAYPRTELGAPSFTKPWLESQDNPLAAGVLQVRRLNRLGSVFVQGTVIDHSVGGRVYCQFHPLRSDNGGAVTGRFSSSNPNLQQIPARDAELAPMVRRLFLPEEGCDWVSLDFSQIEPRVLVHYAYEVGCQRAGVARDKYINDLNTDYHQMMADMTRISRRDAKTINLGLIYGMGRRKLAVALGMTSSEADALFSTYHKEAPFVQSISSKVAEQANRVGYIRTLLGRRRRFDLWERPWSDDQVWSPPLPYETAKRVWDGYAPEQETPAQIAAWREEGRRPIVLRRAHTHKAANALFQGSAADIIKLAMVRMMGEGIIPHLTIHDEVCLSVAKGEEGARTIARVKEIMETCVQLHIPLLVKTGVGPNWGEAEHD